MVSNVSMPAARKQVKSQGEKGKSSLVLVNSTHDEDNTNPPPLSPMHAMTPQAMIADSRHLLFPYPPLPPVCF